MQPKSLYRHEYIYIYNTSYIRLLSLSLSIYKTEIYRIIKRMSINDNKQNSVALWQGVKCDHMDVLIEIALNGDIFWSQ